MVDAIAVTADNRNHYLVRPLRRDDRSLIEYALKKLSARTLYSRFHSRGIRLGPRDLDHLTNTDGRDHVAWLAVDPDENTELPAIALGRYLRSAQRPDRAEVALTICDRHQGRGVSKVLLGALCASASAAGIERFYGSLQAENLAMRRLMESLGAVLTVENGLISAEAPVNPWQLRDSGAAQRVRRVAAQVATGLATQRRSASKTRILS